MKHVKLLSSNLPKPAMMGMMWGGWGQNTWGGGGQNTWGGGGQNMWSWMSQLMGNLKGVHTT